MVDFLPYARVPHPPERHIDRPPRRKILRQHPPRAAAAFYIPDGIINIPRRVFARATEMFRLKKSWLNMDSSQFTRLGQQEFQQESEQAFAPDTDVMHELKEAQVKRQFFLRDAPMGS